MREEQEPQMSAITIDDDQLKALLKQALLELFEEKSEILHDAIAEVVEEIGLTKAIQEERASPTVDKADVLDALEQRP